MQCDFDYASSIPICEFATLPKSYRVNMAVYLVVPNLRIFPCALKRD